MPYEFGISVQLRSGREGWLWLDGHLSGSRTLAEDYRRLDAFVTAFDDDIAFFAWLDLTQRLADGAVLEWLPQETIFYNSQQHTRPFVRRTGVIRNRAERRTIATDISLRRRRLGFLIGESVDPGEFMRDVCDQTGNPRAACRVCTRARTAA